MSLPLEYQPGGPCAARHAWFFEDALAVQRLCKAAAEWDKTPFRENSRAQGERGGIDCVGLVEVLLTAAGVAGNEPFTFARSSADYSPHLPNPRILRYLRGRDDDPQSKRLAAIFAEITNNASGYMPGDLLILRTGKGLYHMPVATDTHGRFVHCLRPLGVERGTMQDSTFAKHVVAHFRAVAR